ncbi:Metaxin-3 [Schistosoma japonicum]|nr:Metaxin-3 [Schistosoma japonicum]
MDLTILSAPDELLPCDPNCLLILCYIRLKEARINIKVKLPDHSSVGEFPVLNHDSKDYHGIPVILTYLRKENYGLEYDLSDTEGVQLCALISTIDRRLAPAVDWFLWADDSVYAKFTRKMYFGSLRFFQQLYIPHIWRNRQINKAKSSQLITCLKNMSESESRRAFRFLLLSECSSWTMKLGLYSLAKLCITSLSYILGENTFFVGDRPTAVDAYVFAFMWPLLMYESQHGDSNWWDVDYKSSSTNYVQSGSHQLITHLLQCPNLMRFFKHILSKYFSKHIKCFRNEKSSIVDKSAVSHPVRDCLLWGAGVVGLFVTYAYYSNNTKILQKLRESRPP